MSEMPTNRRFGSGLPLMKLFVLRDWGIRFAASRLEVDTCKGPAAPERSELHSQMMTLIEFSVKLTEKDIMCLYDEVRPYWGVLILIAYIAIVLGMGGVFLGPDFWPLAAAIISGGVSVVLLPRGSKALLVRQFRKTPGAFGTVRYEFRRESVTMVSETGRSELKWEGFLKRKETPGFLCLYLSPITGCVIPLAQVTSAQAGQLRELVQSRVPAAVGIHSADIPVA